MSSSDGDAGAAGSVNALLVLEPDLDLDPDPEACERLTRQLRAELTKLGVKSDRLAAGGTPPEGAKGTDPVTVGAVIVALSASGGVLSGLIETLRGWLDYHSRRHRISVTIDGDTIELERATAGQQRDLVDAYVRRHSVE
ncbi:MAG: hypothetical protein LC799_05345 [Actinobacteria bacterium]|nr:hypothetical protein [Actinomycetota bacterium]